jgi:hypothetical protein
MLLQQLIDGSLIRPLSSPQQLLSATRI